MELGQKNISHKRRQPTVGTESDVQREKTPLGSEKEVSMPGACEPHREEWLQQVTETAHSHGREGSSERSLWTLIALISHGI